MLESLVCLNPYAANVFIFSVRKFQVFFEKYSSQKNL